MKDWTYQEVVAPFRDKTDSPLFDAQVRVTDLEKALDRANTELRWAADAVRRAEAEAMRAREEARTRQWREDADYAIHRLCGMVATGSAQRPRDLDVYKRNWRPTPADVLRELSEDKRKVVEAALEARGLTLDDLDG